jgi:methylated-DNA-[protein]-cysteine S-methyltransferase
MASSAAAKKRTIPAGGLSRLESPSQIRIEQVDSPVGRVVLASSGDILCGLYFAETPEELIAHLKRRYDEFKTITGGGPSLFRLRLEDYFQGNLSALDDLPVDPGGTPFQRDVWAALLQIPVGSTSSYAEIAKRVGRPAAVRAVGAANGSNPISLVIPCHRVIGSDGSLTGYGGGMNRKDWLLRHEGFLPRSLFQ